RKKAHCHVRLANCGEPTSARAAESARYQLIPDHGGSRRDLMKAVVAHGKTSSVTDRRYQLPSCFDPVEFGVLGLMNAEVIHPLCFANERPAILFTRSHCSREVSFPATDGAGPHQPNLLGVEASRQRTAKTRPDAPSPAVTRGHVISL